MGPLIIMAPAGLNKADIVFSLSTCLCAQKNCQSETDITGWTCVQWTLEVI